MTILTRPWKAGVLLGSLAGLVVAAMAVLAAWDHNPQGEFHNELAVNWGGLALIGLSWFFAAAGALSVVVGALLALLSRVQRRGAV